MVDSTQASAEGDQHRSVLAINSGSSSIKFALFTLGPEPDALARGNIEGGDRATAIDQLFQRIADPLTSHPLAVVGHRIVHGGPTLRTPQRVTPALIDTLSGLARFAPNHLPDEIELIRTVRSLRPELPQIVCFDTAFHASLPELASRLAIPLEYAAQGLKRYGFHGLSYTFLVGELRRRVGAAQAGKRLILAHLGNGSSLAAVRGGQPVDTSMGFTPIGGVVMSTRSGDLDPGVVTYIARSTGFDADQVEHELSHRSGLAGLSGGNGDMRELLAREAGDERCRLAVSIYCYEIKKRIGAYAAALGGVDHLVFAGGIGEHVPGVRARICDGLDFLGITLDPAKNASSAPLISAAAARVAVHVMATDEEIVIARAATELLQ